MTSSLSLLRDPPGRIPFSSANLFAMLRKYVTIKLILIKIVVYLDTNLPFSSDNWLGFHSKDSLGVSGSIIILITLINYTC